MCVSARPCIGRPNSARQQTRERSGHQRAHSRRTSGGAAFCDARPGQAAAWYWRWRCPAVGSARASAAAARSQLNAWLRIGADDSITILVDRSEMGQGVYTALPMLLAEELEIDLSRVNVVAAPVGDAYVNVLNGGQITGTSNSVPDAWEKLRKAGAQARSMLIAAAAQTWHVDPSDCRAIDGRIVSAQGKTATYGAARRMPLSKLPVPKDVVLKDAAQFRLIGKPLPRLDTPSKVDGSAEFGLDVQLPGMLYAVIALCPTLGGKAVSVDVVRGAGAAGRAPGAADGQWSGGRGGAFLAGQKGARCPADRLGSGS